MGHLNALHMSIAKVGYHSIAKVGYHTLQRLVIILILGGQTDHPRTQISWPYKLRQSYSDCDSQAQCLDQTSLSQAGPAGQFDHLDEGEREDAVRVWYGNAEQ